jgi:hypothetical protein
MAEAPHSAPPPTGPTPSGAPENRGAPDESSPEAAPDAHDDRTGEARARPAPPRAVAAAVGLGRALLPRLPRAAAFVAIVLVGAGLGAAVTPSTRADVGPIQAQVRVVPSFDPGVRLLLPPVGEVEFDTHRAPVALEARVAQVDPDGARTLISSPAQLRALTDTAPRVLLGAAVRAALLTIAFSIAGAVGLSLLVYRRRWIRTAEIAGAVVVALILTAGATALTAEPRRLAQPRFTGLLSQAPYIAGEVPSVLARLETYRSGLADIVRSVTALYATTGEFPEGAPAGAEDTVTVLHVSDIHLNPLAFDLIDKLVAQFGVDVVVDSGDITTWGTDVESRTLSRISGVGVPYVFVRGNHDSTRTAAAVAVNRNAVVLDNRAVEVGGVVMAGIADPEFTPDGEESDDSVAAPATPDAGAAQDPQVGASEQLAETIKAWDAANPGRRVTFAVVHDPTGIQPLLGTVPVVLAGHMHKRETRTDPTGTQVLIEGSTGGAGITARGLERLSNGEPLPLAASLIHLSTRGERAGQIVAVDAITVGGFGLTSVSLERTLVPPVEENSREPAQPTPTPSP